MRTWKRLHPWVNGFGEAIARRPGGRVYAGVMAIARLHGGPLDGQIIPLDPAVSDSYIVPYGEGQLVYRREGGELNTGDHDGPTEARYVYVEATEDIDPNPDGRDD